MSGHSIHLAQHQHPNNPKTLMLSLLCIRQLGEEYVVFDRAEIDKQGALLFEKYISLPMNTITAVLPIPIQELEAHEKRTVKHAGDVKHVERSAAYFERFAARFLLNMDLQALWDENMTGTQPA